MGINHSTRKPGRGGAGAGDAAGAKSRIARRLTIGAVPVLAVGAALAAAAGSFASTHHATHHNATQLRTVPNAKLGTAVFGTLPPVGKAPAGSTGTVTIGQLTGQTPLAIFPIVPGAQSSTGTGVLISNLFIPMYNGPKGARPQYDPTISAAAGPPKMLDGGKAYKLTVKSGLKWSDGSPVTGQDLAFDIDLLKAAVKESASNWGQYTPGQFPADVTGVKVNGQSVTIKLNKAYNPGYFLYNQMQVTNYGVYPLPSKVWNVASAGGKHITDWATNPADAKKIFDYLLKTGTAVSQFTNPLWKTDDGPFQLKSYNTTNNSYVLTPNPDYGLKAVRAHDTIDFNTYTSNTAELNAVKTGSLDIGDFDASEIPQIDALKSQGFTVFGGPGWGWFGGQLNYLNTTGHFNSIISQLYIRQALQSLINQPADIKGIYKGAAVPAYGPIPSDPASPYTPRSATHPYYPFSPKKAVALLKSHGWDVKPGGQTTCAKPGSAKNECGKGIPAGTPLVIQPWANQPEAAAPTGVLETEAFESQAKQSAGIKVILQTKTFNFLIQNYNNANPAAKKYVNQWGVNNYGGLFQNFFPTAEGAWNKGGGFNTGGYFNPTAEKLMTNSVFGKNAHAVTKEADFFAKNLPILFFPDQDTLRIANTKKVASSNVNAWTALSQQSVFPQFFYAKSPKT